MVIGRKDPAIKLFGKRIEIGSESGVGADEAGGVCGGDSSSGGESAECEVGAAEMDEKVSEVPSIEGLKQRGEDESVDETIALEAKEDQEIRSLNFEKVNPKKKRIIVTEEKSSKEQTSLKKPDKVLQCPRCESMDTKFCYYNNYNVLQPRHFCRGCQRYWTAGGTMRNVPVGAGKRKSKNSAPQNHYLTVSEASGGVSPNGFVPVHPGLVCGSVLTLGSDGELCASSMKEMPFMEHTGNLTPSDQDRLVKSHEAGDINSSGSCITASNETESKHNGNTSPTTIFHGSLAQMPCIPTWPYPWNAAIPPAALPHPGFTVPLVPPTYWPCTAIPNAWTSPWLPLQASTDVNGVSILGKHSLDGEMLALATGNSEKQVLPEQTSVLKPKALRIVHPEEARKSSIWKTLGIKNETLRNGGFLNDLKFMDAKKNKVAPENHAQMTSNPAALSRSLNFHEQN